MTAAKVTLREIDLSTRVPGFEGVYGAIVIQSDKGPIDEPFLVTSDTQLLAKYTVNDKVAVGDDLAFYSALEFLKKSKRLWVMRAHNIALYGGYVFVNDTSSNGNAALTGSNDDPTAYTFAVSPPEDLFLLHGKNPGVWNNKIKVKVTTHGTTDIKVGSPNITIASGVATLTVAQETGEGTVSVEVGDLINYTVSSTAMKVYITGRTSSTVFTVLDLDGTTPADQVSPVAVDSIYGGLIESSAQFRIDVYWDTDITNTVETFNCSRIAGTKDGNGKSIYIEDVLDASEYIGVVDNVAFSSLALPAEAITAVTFAVGGDGGTVASNDMATAANFFLNKEAYPVTVFMDGAWATEAYHIKLITIAETRQDCVAILSSRYEDENTSSYITALDTYRNVTLNANSSYAAIYTSHVLISDEYNNRKLYIGPDGFVAGAISSTSEVFELWYPVAGSRRGVIRALDVRRRYTEGEMDLLYDVGINPIRFKRGKGMQIHGHKTLSTRPSALDRLNVRLLLIYIEPPIMEALDDFLFELNDEPTRNLIKTMIDSYMEDIQSRRGVYDFKVVCDDSNNSAADIDNYRLNVWLFVKPVKGVEFIKFTVVITRTGANFTQVAENI